MWCPALVGVDPLCTDAGRRRLFTAAVGGVRRRGGISCGGRMLVRMYSIAIAEAGASNQLWAVLQAGRELRAAAAVLDDAGGSLGTLSADTQWHSDGVRALQQKLLEFTGRTSTESTEVRDRAFEVERIQAP